MTTQLGSYIDWQAEMSQADPPLVLIPRAFRVPASVLDGCVVHIAVYHDGDYSAHALVVYEEGGALYEVNAFHCSCYGLEGQWKPEETGVAALLGREFYWMARTQRTGVRAVLEALAGTPPTKEKR